MNINKLLSEQRDRTQEIAERLQATASAVYQDMPTDADETSLNHRAHQLMAAAREVGLLQVELAKAAGQSNVIAQVLRDLPLREVG